MTYLEQIAAYPSLLIGPMVAAAFLSGIVSLLLGQQNRSATSRDVDIKIAADRQITDAKFQHERDAASSEKAWADYGVRRDIYVDLAKYVDALFGKNTYPTEEERIAARKSFNDTARTVRLIGSDAVVLALNKFTAGIRNNETPEKLQVRFSTLMNEARKDIRTLNALPPASTALDESAFPIES